MKMHLCNLPPNVDVFNEMLGAEIAVLEIDVSNRCVIFQSFVQGAFLFTGIHVNVRGNLARPLTMKPCIAPEGNWRLLY
jgi:hypothetical protein